MKKIFPLLFCALAACVPATLSAAEEISADAVPAREVFDAKNAAILGVVCLLVKIVFMLFVIIWIRWTVPRFRFDQVMRVGWKLLLPFAIANLVAYLVGFGVWDGLLK